MAPVRKGYVRPLDFKHGCVDMTHGGGGRAMAPVRGRAQAPGAHAGLPALLHAKQQRRQSDEAHKPLAAYRDEELTHMRRNFYGFDPSYHIARSNFVRRVAPSWTPRHLAVHRLAGVANPPAAQARVDEDQGSGEPESRKSRR